MITMTMMNDPANAKIGAISLWSSILGIIIPVLIALFVRMLVTENLESYFMLSGLLFVGMELIALVTGIIGRKSASGKVGLGISCVCLAGVLLVSTFLMPVGVSQG